MSGAWPDVARRQVWRHRGRVPRRVRIRDADHDQRGVCRIGHARARAGDSRGTQVTHGISAQTTWPRVRPALQVLWRHGGDWARRLEETGWLHGPEQGAW